MELKFAVALLKGDNQQIMGIFDTKEEADRFGESNRVPHDKGLQYCFSTMFSRGGIPKGDSIRIYSYYNA